MRPMTADQDPHSDFHATDKHAPRTGTAKGIKVFLLAPGRGMNSNVLTRKTHCQNAEPQQIAISIRSSSLSSRWHAPQ